MIKTSIKFSDYNKATDITKNSIGIVCFYGGDWRTGCKFKSYNVVYLIKTIASLLLHVEEVIVYVCEDGLDFLSHMFDRVSVRAIEVPEERDICDGEVKLVRPVGKYALIEESWSKYDFVFFTESDHVVYSNNLAQMADRLQNNQFLSAHRFEQDYLSYNHHGQPKVCFDDKKYVLYNDYEEEFSDFDDCFVTAETYRASYSAAWMARCSSLKNIDFNKYENKSLHSHSLVMFESLQCLKTKCRFDFFVDHLSGFDNALKKGGMDIGNFPGRW